MSLLQHLAPKMLLRRANPLTPLLARPLNTEAKFKTHPYTLHNLEKGPEPEITLKREEVLTFYEQMATIRRMETALSMLYKSKLIRGFCHLYSGEEAVAVGVFAHLKRNQDIIIATYRCHGWAYLCQDLNPYGVFAEMIGVKSGSERGKGGSMHIYHKMLYGGNAIVGAHVPVGVGVALAHKYRKTGFISVTVYGDGAANNGQVYEAYNMAKLWDVPALLLCENNVYAMGTKITRGTKDPNVFRKGGLIPGILVDGMDLPTVWEATRFAKEHITGGCGPIIMQVQAYRFWGHSMSDPGISYRSREEVQEVRKTKCPLNTFKAKILEAGLVTEEEIKTIDAKVKKLIDECSQKAQADKVVELAELTYDMYAKALEKRVRGVSVDHVWEHKNTREPFNIK